jgi:16S rRNA (uracil1498-N3)-methyltransferase
MRDRTDPIAPRFHCPQLAEAAGAGSLELGPTEAHHALHVLRLQPGSPVTVFDGRGRRAPAVVCSAGRREVAVELTGAVDRRPAETPSVHLASAVPKGKRLDWLLEKATELGAASVTWVTFARSVAGGGALSASARRRQEAHCISAAKQSGRDWLPVLSGPIALGDWLADAPDEGVRLVGACDQTAGPPGRILTGGESRIDLLIGPEGGLTDEESAAARQAHCLPVRLGQATLRIETASLALLAAARTVAESGPLDSE